MSAKTWLVRAGRHGQILDDFLEKNVVAIGWKKLGDLTAYKDKKALLKAVTGCRKTGFFNSLL